MSYALRAQVPTVAKSRVTCYVLRIDNRLRSKRNDYNVTPTSEIRDRCDIRDFLKGRCILYPCGHRLNPESVLAGGSNCLCKQNVKGIH